MLSGDIFRPNWRSQGNGRTTVLSVWYRFYKLKFLKYIQRYKSFCKGQDIRTIPFHWFHQGRIYGVGPGGPGPSFVRGFFFLNFQHYMFNKESRYLLILSVQNALDCISENFNLKNFPAGAYARNSLEKYAFRSPPYCHCISYLQAPSITKSSVPPSARARGAPKFLLPLPLLTPATQANVL